MLAPRMKSLTYILILLITLTSCSKKEQKKFQIELEHYSCKIEFNRLNDFDTLLVWNWYNDNVMSNRKCYRIQNSKLGIMLENGMSPKKTKQIDQLTIKTPIKPNEFPNFTISEWLLKNKEINLSERPNDKIFKFDSLTVDNKKFGVFGIKTIEHETKVIYMTNINNELIEFEFHSNLNSHDSFYMKSLNMMRTIKIIPTENKS